MRHRKLSQRLSRPLGHRRATMRNLVIALLKHQKIKTTKAKAKQVQSFVEPIIALAKQDNLHSRRHAFKVLNNKMAVRGLFSQVAPLFKDRTSGFTRIIHLTTRRGDAAEIVFLELTEKLAKIKPVKPKKAELQEVKKVKPEPELEVKEKPKMPKEKPRPAKKLKPKKFLGGLRRLFKKERDSL